VTNSQLVSKVYFPRLILPLSTFLSTLVDFAVGLAFFGVLLAIYGLPVGSSLLQLPLWTALVLALALGCGLVAGALAVQYRDVQYVLPVAVPFLLYASPVAYAVTAVPASYRWAFAINPLTAPLEGSKRFARPRDSDGRCSAIASG
jgi:lipopolysaccharide transport system permease protein